MPIAFSSSELKFVAMTPLKDLRIFGRLITNYLDSRYLIATRYSPRDTNTFNALKEIQSKIQGEFSEISGLLIGLKEQTVRTKWITAEIDRITALIYFMVTISVFIVAIVILPDLLHKFAQVFKDIELVRIGVLIFSVSALVAVSVMWIYRIKGLLNKAWIVFRHLTALEAIKVDKEK